VKIAMQSSSHNWESEIRVPVVRVLRTKADCAVWLRCGKSGKIPKNVGFMTSPLAEINVTHLNQERSFASGESRFAGLENSVGGFRW
jgi:hypothetical protein